jgi:hypothetical protein
MAMLISLLIPGYETSATNAMNQLNRDFATKGLTQLSLLITIPFGDEGIKRTVDLVRSDMGSHDS